MMTDSLFKIRQLKKTLQTLIIDINKIEKQLSNTTLNQKKKSHLNRSFIIHNLLNPITLSELTTIISNYYNIDPELLKKEKTERTITEKRSICCFFAIFLTIDKFSSIGFYFGKKSPPAIYRSAQRLYGFYTIYPNVKSELDEINKLFKSKYNTEINWEIVEKYFDE